MTRQRLTPEQAWTALQDGNDRFVRGEMQHPSQDADHRAQVSAGQSPFAVLFGCSDSRVAAEIVFDQGLGDLFVVRTAGHVLDTTVIGSIEYGVDVLGASLVVVLGHDSCGAVGAAAEALATGRMPSGFVRAVVDRVIPSIVNLPEPGQGDDAGGQGDGSSSDAAVRGAEPRPLLPPTPEVLGREHVRHTVRMLQSYSASVRESVQEGRCAVLGLEYALVEGKVRVVEAVGPVTT